MRSIAGEMQAFDAANVVYNRRTAALIKQVLDENEITGQVIQSSSFLQNLGWLQPSTRRQADRRAGRPRRRRRRLDRAARPGCTATASSRVSVGDKTLAPDAANSIAAIAAT